MIQSKSGLSSARNNEWMEAATWNSWLGNGDGEGYLAWTTDGFTTERTLQKARYNRLAPARRILSHQRYATSGFTESNTHPAEGKHFALLHNGIFSGLGDKDVSDTRHYLDKLEANYEESGSVLQAVRDTNAVIDGSYSVFLVEKETGDIYYYKEWTTAMYLLSDKKRLIMSTSEANIRIAREMFGIKRGSRKVKANVLYKVEWDGLKKVGTFKNAPTPKAAEKLTYYNGVYDEDFADLWRPARNAEELSDEEIDEKLDALNKEAKGGRYDDKYD
jgi:hypothetical protein